MSETVRTDQAGFERHWGVHVFRTPGAPWVSLGVHFDWHTPSLEFHLPRTTIQLGRNNWERGRFKVYSQRGDGHSTQCTCDRGDRNAKRWDPRPLLAQVERTTAVLEGRGFRAQRETNERAS